MLIQTKCGLADIYRGDIIALANSKGQALFIYGHTPLFQVRIVEPPWLYVLRYSRRRGIYGKRLYMIPVDRIACKVHDCSETAWVQLKKVEKAKNRALSDYQVATFRLESG